MITRDDIARLGSLNSDNGIVTAYVGIDPRIGYDRKQPTQSFKLAYARARRDADERTLATLERERDRFIEYLDSMLPEGRGLVIISSIPDNIWEVWQLDVVVPSWVIVAQTPETQVLARILDQEPRLAVVVLEGAKASVFIGQRGHEQLSSKSHGQLPGRHSQGGWSQARYQRHREFHHDVILRDVATKLANDFNNKGFDRLAIVGVDESTKEFEAMLPEPMRQRVIGHISVDFKQETEESLLDRARLLAEDDEQRTALALVEEIVGNADAGGKGVTGIDATLEALVAQRVDILAAVDGIIVDGTICANCDYLSARRFEQCPVCSQISTQDVPDLIDEAIERAYREGARVTFATGVAAELLTSRGGLAALLRY